MTDQKTQEQKSPQEDKPNYANWDYPTWIKNNPNATEKEIRQWLKDRSNRQRLGL